MGMGMEMGRGIGSDRWRDLRDLKLCWLLFMFADNFAADFAGK